MPTGDPTTGVDDKLFDCFLIHSSDDFETVRSRIAEPVEERSNYRLCIADRDFIAGRLIADNIQEALMQSRGVLMAVSQRFVDSQWCNYEFFQAYARAIEISNFQLVLVLLDRIEEIKNPPELLVNYYKHYTCISVEEDNFERKLVEILNKQLVAPLADLTASSSEESSVASSVDDLALGYHQLSTDDVAVDVDFQC